MKKLFTTVLFAACTLAASAEDYYVSVNGAGNGDGKSWENAWSVAELKEKLKKTTNYNTDRTPDFNDSGDNIHFASGTYKFGQALNIIKKGINLIGATGVERTVFSGDVNNDNVPSSGDLENLVYIRTDALPGTTEKCINISNIDFTCLYINQNGSEFKGAIAIENSGAYVTVENCNFTNLMNIGQGANALFSKRSSVKFVDCQFTGNTAVNRGIVARMQSSNESKKGFTTFERCFFANNEATGATKDPCGVVMMQHGQELNIVNCTFSNNKCNGTGAAIYNKTDPDSYYQRVMNVKNCYFLNNTSADNHVILENSATTTTNNYIGADTEFPSINVTSVGVATYYLGASFTMPKGLTGKTFAEVQDNMLVVDKVYTEGRVVPAGTALLIEGAEGTYNPVLAVSEEVAPEVNLLKGDDVATQTTGGDFYYKLANGKSGLGFYWADPDGAFAFESAAHKAYLCLNTAGARKAFFFNGETTGIEGVNGSSFDKLRNHGVKVLKNGRLVIEKGGKTYNAVGAEVM